MSQREKLLYGAPPEKNTPFPANVGQDSMKASKYC
jgi:hypothetical protein